MSRGSTLMKYANIKMPGDFIREIATIRSRRIYAKIFIQSISQLKSIHEKDLGKQFLEIQIR